MPPLPSPRPTRRNRPPATGRVPVEFIGLARALRNKISAAHPAAEVAAAALIAPFRPRPGFTPMPRHSLLRALAAEWRALPSRGRLRLVARFDAGKLQIAEVRVIPSHIRAAGWAEGEPALAMLIRTIVIAPPVFAERSLVIAAIGLHALARRFERGRDRGDAAVLRDLMPIAAAYAALARVRGDFEVPVPAGGRWIGAIAAADATALVRTFMQ